MESFYPIFFNLLVGKLRYEVISWLSQSCSVCRTKTSPSACTWVQRSLQDVSAICLQVSNLTFVITELHSQQWLFLALASIKLAQPLPESWYLLVWSSYVILPGVYREWLRLGSGSQWKGGEDLSHFWNVLQILCASLIPFSLFCVWQQFADVGDWVLH